MEYLYERKNTDLAAYLFHEGTNYRAQDYMGAHRMENGYVFRVWAPHATAVYVVGSFNEWGDTVPMTRTTEGGIWTATVPPRGFGEGSLYKFKLITPAGVRYKADPYARRTGRPPETASVYTETESYLWHDGGWMAYRKRAVSPTRMRSHPMNVYELHLGSWKRHEDGSVYTYEETARELIPYVKQMGYTHVELLPVTEHPCDSSRGYQVTGYFAPTARFGTPQDFMAFVDAMHGAGIGVILDWVPAHFAKDAHGLIEFDGQPLYEYDTPERMEFGAWGTRRFAIGRREVECFLISSAGFWADTYHIDGIRVDAVSAMLGADTDGKGASPEAVAFFRKLNTMMSTRFPDVMTIAEASGEHGKVTSFADGGLGFTMQWNMGWMNDTLSYVALPFAARGEHHRKITFSMMYSFREQYMLPVSHDEVERGKRSLLDRMPGDYWQKFAGCRALLGYMMTHPGKKLLFMGCEIGQFREWRHDDQVEWFLTDYDQHAALQQYVAELNHLYLQTPALHEIDDSWAGFRWIDPDNGEQSVLSYRRIDGKGRELVVVINFTPRAYENYCVGVPDAGVYEEIFNSDDRRFGGGGVTNTAPIRTRPERLHGLPDTLNFRLPPLGMAIFRCRRKQPRIK
ncbi:MAG: 1,4-alpha-glucan branching protein GlgB [Clostridia bacterium]|nr:1,4-alpha-glucan branching protein GlgB [Clostridia bacterium]